MDKIELLAPAGNLNSFYVAINNGADAVYLGSNHFSARANAHNFSEDELSVAIKYAHARNRKVYLAMNTLISDEDLSAALELVNITYQMGIDGFIVQDFGLLSTLIGLETKLIGSTQINITNLDGVLFLQQLGVQRVVMAREVSLLSIENIIENSKMEIEVFAHGALCVSYSGQCLLSYFIGGRSGNRGVCAQPCRKQYTLVNNTLNSELTKKSYLLSLKDLNTMIELPKLIKSGIKSLKIEGRMKSSEYVANITANYRKAIDNYYKLNNVDLHELNYNNSITFNRGYTFGHLFNTAVDKMSSTVRPNNQGIYIGKISKSKHKDYIEIELSSSLYQNDIILIESNNDIVYKVSRLYDHRLNLINSCHDEKCYIQMREKVQVGCRIFKVYDHLFNSKLMITSQDENYRLPLDVFVRAKAGLPLEIQLKEGNYSVTKLSNSLLQKALKTPVSIEQFKNLLCKLNDTPYYLNTFQGEVDEDVFISLREINELRRVAINELIDSKNNYRRPLEFSLNLQPLSIERSATKIAVKVHNKAQYELVKSLGIEIIYFENIYSNTGVSPLASSASCLVSNYGGFVNNPSKELIGDHHLNIYNSLAAYNLFKAGANRITLSLEVSVEQLRNLYGNFCNNYHCNPAFEYVVYGQMEVMVSKYCLLKGQNLCGQCRKYSFGLKDDYSTFKIYTDDLCHMHIIHHKALNKLKELKSIIPFVNVIRLEFLDEDESEIRALIALCKEAID